LTTSSANAALDPAAQAIAAAAIGIKVKYKFLI
jgi:hypothetical protein